MAALGGCHHPRAARHQGAGEEGRLPVGGAGEGGGGGRGGRGGQGQDHAGGAAGQGHLVMEMNM